MKPRTKRILFWVSISPIILLLILAISLLYYQQAYAGKIYKNVHFGSINLSGLSKYQAEKAVKAKVADLLDKEITFESNGKTVKAKIRDTGLSFNEVEIIQNSYQIGRSGSFLENILKSSKTIFTKSEISALPILNQTKYDDFLNIAIHQLNSNPVNATLVIENGQIKTTENQDGNTVIEEAIVDKIIDLVGTKQTTVKLESEIVSPEIKNANFESARQDAEKILNSGVVLKYEDKEFKPTKEEIGKWIVFNNNNNVFSASLNDSNVKAYLNKIAASFEIKKIDKTVNSITNETIKEGQEGLYLNKDEALTALKNSLSGNQKSTIILTTHKEAPKDIKVAPAEGFLPGRFEGKYIDVDLTQQKACRFEGMQMIDCYMISSGKPGMDTPTGTFYIQNKNPRQWSRRYALWMPYWQGFYGDYGLHELPEWPSGRKEGEQDLGIPVSHGCVRFGMGTAKLVFEWTEIGTPVYIHK